MTAPFTVTQIINGITFRVIPGWKWNNYEGSLVVIKGIQTDPSYNLLITHRLNNLLINRPIELKNATKIINLPEGTAIHCSVYLNEIDITQYFPEVKTV